MDNFVERFDVMQVSLYYNGINGGFYVESEDCVIAHQAGEQ